MRTRHVDFVAVVEDSGLVGTADEDLLAHAATFHPVLITVNAADFAAIATDWRAAGGERAGAIHVTSRAFPHDRSSFDAIVSSSLPHQQPP